VPSVRLSSRKSPCCNASRHASTLLQSLFAVNRQRRINRAQEVDRVVIAAGVYRRGERIIENSLRRIRRCCAGDGAIGHCAEGVDVRPWALLAARGILLDGRITGRDHAGNAAALAADFLPRRAEVDQHRRAGRCDDDVAGLDVAVHKTGAMHFRQAVQQRVDNFTQKDSFGLPARFK